MKRADNDILRFTSKLSDGLWAGFKPPKSHLTFHSNYRRIYNKWIYLFHYNHLMKR